MLVFYKIHIGGVTKVLCWLSTCLTKFIWAWDSQLQNIDGVFVSTIWCGKYQIWKHDLGFVWKWIGILLYCVLGHMEIKSIRWAAVFKPNIYIGKWWRWWFDEGNLYIPWFDINFLCSFNCTVNIKHGFCLLGRWRTWLRDLVGLDSIWDSANHLGRLLTQLNLLVWLNWPGHFWRL